MGIRLGNVLEEKSNQPLDFRCAHSSAKKSENQSVLSKDNRISCWSCTIRTRWRRSRRAGAASGWICVRGECFTESIFHFYTILIFSPAIFIIHRQTVEPGNDDVSMARTTPNDSTSTRGIQGKCCYSNTRR